MDQLEPLSGQQGTNNAPLAKHDWSKFVQFFRQASPYISGHRDRTFVIVIPGNVSRDKHAAPCGHACVGCMLLTGPAPHPRCPVNELSSTQH